MIIHRIDLTSGSHLAAARRFGAALVLAFLISSGSSVGLPDNDSLLSTWVERPLQTSPPPSLTAITYGQGKFVAGGLDGLIFSSEDGISWQQQVAPVKIGFYDFSYGNGRFVGVGFSQNGKIAGLTSTNGVDWTAWSLPYDGWIVSLAFGNGLFIGGSGSGEKLFSSTDGLKWDLRQTNDWQFHGVAFGDNQFVAITTLAAAIWRSPDGEHWIEETNKLDSLRAVAYGNGRFVILAQHGSLISSNGVDWVFIRNPLDPNADYFQFDRVHFYNGVFFAVDSHLGLFTSMDGISWTKRVASPAGIGGVTSGHGTIVAIMNSKIYQSAFLLPPPRFLPRGLSQLGAQGLTLNISSLPDVDVNLEISDNLIDWVPERTTANPSGQLEILDPLGPQVRQRFYRLRVHPP